MTYEKSLFIGRTVLIVIVCLLIGGAFLYADHGKVKKGGYDLYWKNKIALANDGAIIIDSLVPEFLEATESFPTDSITGELLTGSQRRTYSPDHQLGWVLKVMERADVIRGDGKLKKIYSIETVLVFDLRMEEKK